VQLSIHKHFRLQKWPKLSIWTLTATARFNKPWSKAQDRRHSVDTHFHDGAGSVSPSFLPIKDGYTSIRCNHYQIAFLLPDLPDHKLLTLHWCGFSRWTRSVSLSFLHIKVVNTVVMYNHSKITSELQDQQDLQSLTLCWRSFSKWGRERVSSFFAYKGLQHFYYVNSLPNCVFITRITWPNIVDALLMIIFTMGLGAFPIVFCV